MCRLPFELLDLIVDFIDAEKSLEIRQSALASLSRTNKTFHNIAIAKLYLHVVLTREKRVGQWGKFYASKLNPWDIKDAMDELKDLVVPSSITFIPSQDDNLNLPTKQIFPRERPSFDPVLAVSTPLTSFFFRNLTSFVVSPGFTLDPKFIATLFAPTQPLRAALVHLDLSGKHLEDAVEFIFGAFNEYEFDMYDEHFDGETYEAQEAEKAAYWERYCDPDEEAGEEPECLWEDISWWAEYSRLVSKAQIEYDCFVKLYRTQIGPHEPDFIESHIPKLYPFSKLESLTLLDPTSRHLDLLFTDPSCLTYLTTLKLIGEFEGHDVYGDDEIDKRILDWREAITRLNGSIIPPSDQSGFFNDRGQLRDVGPVPRDWYFDTYAGLNLCIFDLSELCII